MTGVLTHLVNVDGCGERVVERYPVPVVVAFEHREVDHEQVGQLVVIIWLTEVEAQPAEHFESGLLLIGDDQQHVACGGLETLLERLLLGIGEELDHR